MPDFAKVIKEEIQRISRKETKPAITAPIILDICVMRAGRATRLG